MIGLIGLFLSMVMMVLIKIKDDEIRASRFRKTVVVYTWLFGIVLFIIQVITWIVGG